MTQYSNGIAIVKRLCDCVSRKTWRLQSVCEPQYDIISSKRASNLQTASFGVFSRFLRETGLK